MNDRLSIGAHYLMKVTLNYSGTAKFTQVNTGLVVPADIIVPASPPDTIHAGTPVDALIHAADKAEFLAYFETSKTQNQAKPLESRVLARGKNRHQQSGAQRHQHHQQNLVPRDRKL